MARGSQPSSPNSRFKVWDLSGDLYSHVELAENWDTLDAIIGRPSNGTDWPPMGQRGVNGGLYLYTKLLEAERAPIGSTTMWWRPSAVVPIPAGYELMDGRVISAANHNFPGIAVDIRLPNALNAVFMGADPAKPVGTKGDITNLPAGAPGVTSHNGLVNVGGGGSNSHTHTHTVAAHSHVIAAHSHVVSSHTHGMSHLHGVSGTTGTPSYIGSGYQLTEGAIQAYVEFTSPGTWRSPADEPGVTRVQRIVPHWSHDHFSGGIAVGASRPATDGSAPDTNAAGGGDTGSVGETTTSGKELDNRPNHIGLIPLMKVRYASSL